MNMICKCGSKEFFTEKHGNQTGLYCSACGKWQKWLKKDEIRLFAHDVPDGWISVKDVLPENGKYVLCWYEYFRYGEYNRMFKTYGIGYHYNGFWGGEVSNGTKAKVLAWRELPDPPRMEKKNDKL